MPYPTWDETIISTAYVDSLKASFTNLYSAVASIIFPSYLLCGPLLQYVLPIWTYLDGTQNIPQRPYKHAYHTHFYQWGKHTAEQTNIQKCHRTNFREMVILPTVMGYMAWISWSKLTSTCSMIPYRGNGLIPSQAWYRLTNTLRKALVGHQRK